MFADEIEDMSNPPPKPRANDTTRETLRLYRAGKNVAQIARERGLTTGTIYNHLAGAIEAGEKIDTGGLVSREEERRIETALAKVTVGGLSAVKELLGERVDYGQIRIYLALRKTG